MWILLGLAALTSQVDAHAPYEHIVARISDPAGRRLQLVALYQDGLVGADPVTVLLRDATGPTLASTEEARDVIVRCPSFELCTIFLYDPPSGVFPKRVLRLKGAGFVAEAADGYGVLAAVLPVTTHWLELLVESVSLAIVPIFAQLLARCRRTRLVIAAWYVLIPAGLLWLFASLLGVALNTKVPFVWLLLVTASLVAIPVVARTLARRGLTRRCS
jgi:hypothetical protein